MKKIFCTIFAAFLISALSAQDAQKIYNLLSQTDSNSRMVKTDKAFEIKPLPPEALQKFLKEELDIQEDVDFAAMFEEVKTYGGFAGLCSQMSEYIKETKRCPELFKFKTKRIHSCDGFFMVKNGWVVFCPTSKQIKAIKDNKVFAMYLDKNFAVCQKPDFYKYLTLTTEGADE
ncbi:MAG: hypothetical protein IKS15_05940 [Opitutales bacterium]|nr:hypothetical protein [Opitutales bacterium]